MIRVDIHKGRDGGRSHSMVVVNPKKIEFYRKMSEYSPEVVRISDFE